MIVGALIYDLFNIPFLEILIFFIVYLEVFVINDELDSPSPLKLPLPLSSPKNQLELATF